MTDKSAVMAAVIAQGFERMAAALRQLNGTPDPNSPAPPILPTEGSPAPCGDLQIHGVIPGVADEVVTSAVVGDAAIVTPTVAPPDVVPTQLVNAYGGGIWEITPDGGLSYNDVVLFHAARLGGRAVELALGQQKNWVRTDTGQWFEFTPQSITPSETGPAAQG